MKALISPSQGNLVVQVEQQEFEVALPLFWVDCDNSVAAYGYTYDNGNFLPYIPPAPTAEENKQKAVTLLQETDWTSVADVGDSSVSNPYLVNQTAFLAWRSQIRAIAVNPTAGNLSWPAKPQEQWSS
jgi:hypothetical protein